MDAVVRHLRDGALPDATSSATCCVLDQLNVIGGPLVTRHVLHSFITAMRQGRSQAKTIRLVDTTGSLTAVVGAALQSGALASRHAGPPDLEVLDLFSDPWGWRAASTSGSTSSSAAQTRTSNGNEPSTSISDLRGLLLRTAQTHTAARVQDNMPSSRPVAGTPGPSDPPSSPPEPAGEQPCAPLTGSGASASASTASGAGSVAATAGAAAESGPVRSVCLVLDCFSTLMERYGETQALALLEAVQRSPLVSCVLTSLHKDLHPDRVLFAVRRLCSCTLELSALSPLQVELAQRAVAVAGNGANGTRAGAPAGRLDCRTKRRTGRVKVESELYSVSASTANLSQLSGGAVSAPQCPPPRLQFFPAPPFLDAPDPKALIRLQPKAPSLEAAAGSVGPSAKGPATVGPTASAQGGAGPGLASSQPMGLLGGVAAAEELARAMGGSMRLTLTEEERRAKQQVVLPYQHQGQQRGAMADAYAAGDHRAYLPPAAGGLGPAAGGSGQQALGHILYVRDSGSEADSDQDLDEDLDI